MTKVERNNVYIKSAREYSLVWETRAPHPQKRECWPLSDIGQDEEEPDMDEDDQQDLKDELP